VKVFEPEFRQDPNIRRRILNWRSAMLFALVVVVLPVLIAFVVGFAGCDCDLSRFAQSSTHAYWQLLLKFAAFGGLAYICGANLIIYLLTKKQRERSR
jgi:hypothetical protein